MTILAFKTKGEGASENAKPAKKRKAVLTVERIPEHQRKAGANFESGCFLGKLVIDGYEFCLDDGNPLGIIAHICNVSSITVAAPVGPEPITLRASTGYHRELELLGDWDEQTFLKRVHTGLWMSGQSRKNNREVFDWWSSGPFQAALAHVPENMRINSSLPRGVYDESGQAMTAKQIAWRAMWERMMGPLKALKDGEKPVPFGRNKPTGPSINWNEIVRMDDPHGPVAINGGSYVAVQNTLLQVGFPRMPQSFAELVQGLEFVESVSYHLGQRTIQQDLDGGASWLAVVEKVSAQYNLPEAALLSACMRRDEKLIAELHAQTDWLAVLAKSYEEKAPKRSLTEGPQH